MVSLVVALVFFGGPRGGVSAAGLPYEALVAVEAERHRVDPLLVHAIIAVESAYDRFAESPAGAQGLMQLMPAIQRDLGVGDVFDPRENVCGGVRYFRWLADQFGVVLAVAAYHAGPAAVRRHGGLPPFPQTRAYLRAVILGLVRLREGYAVR